MKILYSKLDESSAVEITKWHYEPPYDIYNLESDDSVIDYVLSPQWNFYAMKDELGSLIGFCSFGKDGQVPGGDYSLEALDIGMGMHPDLTGKGQGTVYIKSIIQFAMDSYKPKRMRVTIAKFNRRAQSVWESNGFSCIQRFTYEPSGRNFLVCLCEESRHQKSTKESSL